MRGNRKKNWWKVSRKLNIPVYLYECAASKEDRKNLSTIRSGEYEGLEEKLKESNWKPDYGSTTFNEKSGALSPAEGRAPKALNGITATNKIMIKAVIFFIVNLSKNPLGRKLDLPCPQFEFSILNYLFKYSKSWSRNLKVISPLSLFLKSGYKTLK